MARVPPGSRRTALAAAAAASLLCAPPHAAGADETAVASRTLSVPRLDHPVVPDGRLDEPVWARAAVARDFVQREPRAGEPASQPTEVLLFYTDRFLFIGARLHDSEPSRIVGSEYRRDASLDANDAFEVFLDTFHDGRNAFYFQTNAVGAQRDALVRNEGESVNWEWDGVWEVGCARDVWGWTVEMVIPFSTLRFRTGSPSGWGANFGRLVARTREESHWAPISRDWGFLAKWRVSAYGRLENLEQARPGGRLALKPFALGGAETEGDRPGEVDPALEAGLDAKVALSSTVIADLTVNTDFAQVEADQQQVNLTRFPLFFPEKREFFLENAGLFQIGERLRPFETPSTLLFFSRRIGLTEDGDPVPLLGGARVTGKLGRYDLGAFDIVADRTTFENDDGELVRLPRTNFAALRLKRDVGARSSAGALLLAKTPADEGTSNQVVAVDASIAPSPTLSILGFAARSFTPGLTGSAHAVGVDLNWETDRGSAMASYVDIGDDFISEMGFLQRTGIRKLRASAGLQRRPGVLGIRQAFVFDDHTYIEDHRGDLQSQLNFLGSGAFFDNGSLLIAGWQHMAEGLTEPFEIEDDVEVPVGLYRFDQALLFFEIDRSRKISGNGVLTSGSFFGGSLHSATLGTQYRPTGRLSFNLDYGVNVVSIPIELGDFTTHLVVSRVAFAFSTQAFLRGLVQVGDDEARYNLLFRLTYRPGSDLYVVYNEDRDIERGRSVLKNRQILAKLTFYAVPR